MKRRSFFGALAGLALAPFVPRKSVPTYKGHPIPWEPYCSEEDAERICQADDGELIWGEHRSCRYENALRITKDEYEGLEDKFYGGVENRPSPLGIEYWLTYK